MYGEEVPREVDPLPTLLTAYPVRGLKLVSIAQDEGIDGGVAEGRDLTLADTIAPHWFIPPEGGEKLLTNVYSHNEIIESSRVVFHRGH